MTARREAADTMRFEKWIRLAFIGLGMLAAIGPGVAAVRLLAALSVVTPAGVTFGWRHWGVLVAVSLLISAVLLETARIRWAPVLAIVALAMLWLYIGPGLWAQMVGEGFFEPTPGFGTAVSWQMASYQIGSTLCALGLTRVRYWAG